MASRFRLNVVANLLSAGWIAAVQIIATPLVVWKLGTGAYGLVGFFTSLAAIFAILDLGLTATLTRLIARRSWTESGRGPADTLRTFETVFAGIGLLLGAGLWAVAPLLADYWLASSVLHRDEVEAAIRWMGPLFFVRWMQAPYLATLQGFQRQAVLGAANAGMYTLTYAVAIAFVWLERPGIPGFFAILSLGTLAQLLVLRWLAWRSDASFGNGRPSIRLPIIKAGWGFSAGIFGISLTATILTQTDKIILSKLVALEQYGVYAMAQVLASGLSVVILPVYNAVYPRLCELVASGEEARVQAFFRSAASLMNATLVPLGATLVLFSFEVMLVWTRDPQLAAQGAPLFGLLVTGTVLNGMMFIPYALQLARGNTKIGLTINVVLCALLVPAIFFLTYRYGLTGGAAASPAMNALYMLVAIPITWKVCLGSGQWLHFYRDLAIGQALPIGMLVAARMMLPLSERPVMLIVEVAGLGALALAISLMLTPGVKQRLNPRAWRAPA